jgi:hypothetical protein
MLVSGYGKNNTPFLTASCPHISNLTTVPIKKGDMLEYQFRAEAIAKNHNYDYLDARQTVNQLVTNGDPNQFTKESIDRFKIMLRGYCDQGQRETGSEESVVRDDILNVVLINPRKINDRGSARLYSVPCYCCGDQGHVLVRPARKKGKISVSTECPHISSMKIGKGHRDGEGEVLTYEIRAAKITNCYRHNWGEACYMVNEIIHNHRHLVSTEGKMDRFRIMVKNRCTEERKQKVLNDFIKAPCKGCGSPFHGLLKYSSKEGKHRYECPGRQQGREGCSEWYEDSAAEYLLCPIKLARENGYSSDRVLVAMKRYEQRGAGRFKSPENTDSLRKKALDTCTRYHEAFPTKEEGAVSHSGGYCPAKIIGIEGWGKPEAGISKGIGTVSSEIENSQRDEEEEKESREVKEALVMISLGMLIILMIHTSMIIPIGGQQEQE